MLFKVWWEDFITADSTQGTLQVILSSNCTISIQIEKKRWQDMTTLVTFFSIRELHWLHWKFLESSLIVFRSTIPCKKIFHSWTSLFSLPLPLISMLSRPQNLLENLAYSTLKRGRGKSTGFNAISLKTRNKSEIVANFGWASQPFCTGS